nr:uncharacterized protein LOC109191080 [Ipomoea batatas]
MPAECQLCQRVDESALHLFVECEYAREWADHHMQNLDNEMSCLLLMVCWKMWFIRNDKVWNGKSVSPVCLVEGTKRYLADWKVVVGSSDHHSRTRNKSASKWEKPTSGFLKLNTDAAVDVQRNRMGYGWVLRDDTGQFVAAACIPGRGLFSPKEAEAMAIREALSWTKRHGVSKIQVESDALQIVQSLKLSSYDSSFDLVILDIKDMLRSLHHVDISHVSRTANSVAHSLAREACSMSVPQEWNSIPPSFIVNALYSDLN